ncbi:MAG: hypothetical protein HQ523_06730 [Lentisphaerae bacterium]|nr:hypothetical protein [Lentisphaerota bacterium]
MKRKLVVITLVVLGLLAILAALHGPVAAWLEMRESWLPDDARVDAVYIMGGQWDHERVDGLKAWLAGGGQTDRILVPEDNSKGRWSRSSHRNLSTGEWMLETLHTALNELQCTVPVEVITLSMEGTDAEMMDLAALVARRDDIGSLALATSRFHIRRTHSRAQKWLGKPPGMIPAISIWQDRSPVVVGAELLKMVRDALGLSTAPMLNRWWWLERLGRTGFLLVKGRSLA